MTRRRRGERPALLATILLSGALGLSSIALPGGTEAPTITTAQASATGGTCRLTGKPAKLRKTRRPALAVRVSNAPDARPQIAVGSADLVIETLIEGGTTRLIPIFHCSSATVTGPVRSARLQDAAITGPITKLLAFSGAHPRVMARLDRSPSVLVTEATEGEDIYREPAGSADVNSLRANLVSLRAFARNAGVNKPRAVFSFGRIQRGRSVSSVTLNFGSTSVTYRWRKRRASWARSQDGSAFRDAAGRRVTAINVLVQEVFTNASRRLVDSAGTPSPMFDLSATGSAYLFRNGRVIEGTWTDPGSGAPVFTTLSGAVMRLARGRTWLEMVPSDEGELKGSITFS